MTTPDMSSPMNRFLAAVFLAAVFLALLMAGCTSDPPPDASPVIVGRPGASFPTVAAEPSGAAVLAWTERQGEGAAVMLARLENGRLSAPVRVSPAEDDVAAHGQAPAQVVLGPEGAVYAAWVAQTPVEGRRFPASEIHLARSSDGGRTFAPAVSVADEVGFLTSRHFHGLAVGLDGAVYVSWLDARERDRPGAAPETAPHDQAPGGGTQLRVARSDDGGRTFAPSVVVAEGTCECCRTSLAVGPDGAVYVAWRHIFTGGIRDIALARSDDGGRTFSEPARLHADGWRIAGCPHTGPAVAVDEAGRVHVAWYTGAEDGRGVFYAASEDGGRTFGAVHALEADVPVAQVSACADGGAVWLAWEDPASGSARVARVGPGETVPELVAEAAGQVAPALAARSGRWLLAGPAEGGFAVRSGSLSP